MFEQLRRYMLGLHHNTMTLYSAQKYVDFGAAEFEGMDEEDALDELIQAEILGYEDGDQQHEEQKNAKEILGESSMRNDNEKEAEPQLPEIHVESKDSRPSNKWDVNGGDDDL